VQACLFGYHAQLREKAPVYRLPETGFFVISNYEDLKTELSDPATFSNDIMFE
jgi:cytochrome P450